MDQNEPSKGTEMNRNVPTRAQSTKIGQNRGNKNKTNDLILNLTPENVTQHSRIE